MSSNSGHYRPGRSLGDSVIAHSFSSSFFYYCGFLHPFSIFDFLEMKPSKYFFTAMNYNKVSNFHRWSYSLMLDFVFGSFGEVSSFLLSLKICTENLLRYSRPIGSLDATSSLACVLTEGAFSVPRFPLFSPAAFSVGRQPCHFLGKKNWSS